MSARPFQKTLYGCPAVCESTIPCRLWDLFTLDAKAGGFDFSEVRDVPRVTEYSAPARQLAG